MRWSCNPAGRCSPARRRAWCGLGNSRKSARAEAHGFRCAPGGRPEKACSACLLADATLKRRPFPATVAARVALAAALVALGEQLRRACPEDRSPVVRVVAAFVIAAAAFPATSAAEFLRIRREPAVVPLPRLGPA